MPASFGTVSVQTYLEHVHGRPIHIPGQEGAI